MNILRTLPPGSGDSPAPAPTGPHCRLPRERFSLLVCASEASVLHELAQAFRRCGHVCAEAQGQADARAILDTGVHFDGVIVDEGAAEPGLRWPRRIALATASRMPEGRAGAGCDGQTDFPDAASAADILSDCVDAACYG